MMGQLSTKLRGWDSGGQQGLTFFCPGCNRAHTIKTSPDGWGWNGDVERPTFTPSVLVTGRDFTPAGQAEYDAWYEAGCPPLNGKQFESAPSVCHSFVTDGQIQFLDDSTHALAGQTVPLADFPVYYQ
jgi:hypothetical protein